MRRDTARNPRRGSGEIRFRSRLEPLWDRGLRVPAKLRLRQLAKDVVRRLHQCARGRLVEEQRRLGDAESTGQYIARFNSAVNAA